MLRKYLPMQIQAAGMNAMDNVSKILAVVAHQLIITCNDRCSNTSQLQLLLANASHSISNASAYSRKELPNTGTVILYLW